MNRALTGQNKQRVQRYVAALARIQVPYEVAAFMVGKWLKVRGFGITTENLKAAFDE